MFQKLNKFVVPPPKLFVMTVKMKNNENTLKATKLSSNLSFSLRGTAEYLHLLAL